MLRNALTKIKGSIFVFVLLVACGGGGFIASLSVNPSSLKPGDSFTIKWKVNYDKTYYVNVYLSPSSTLPNNKSNYLIVSRQADDKEISLNCIYEGYFYNCYLVSCDFNYQCISLEKKNAYIVIEACKEENKNCSTKSVAVTLN